MTRLRKVLADPQPTPLELAGLLRAVAEGDAQAFVTAFDFYAPRVKAFLIRRGLAEGAAEDLAQETLTRVWRRAGSFDPLRGSASGWVYAIARNALIDALRADRRPTAFYDVVAMPPTPAEDCLALERDAVIGSFLRDLPPGERAAIKAAFFEDLSHGAIVATYGLPLGTVKSRIRSAIQRLRKQLADYHDF